jgi:two-component sensor histidine kinase
VLEPYADGAGRSRWKPGRRWRSPPRRAQALALVLHELATNAVKHGALSAPGGRVRVGWEVEIAGMGRLRACCGCAGRSGAARGSGRRPPEASARA